MAAALVLAVAIGGFLYAKGDDTPSAPSTVSDGPAAISTIAVLPFVNTGGDAQDEYFSDGLTEELANAVSRIPNVRVAGRSSSYAYKGKPTSAQEIGKALAVGGVIEGTVRRSGDRLRVTAQLASTADGKVLWSNTYESNAKDVFQIQDEFTRAIVAALSPALQGQSASAASSELRGTANVEAYDLYLKGRYFWGRRGVDGVARAIDYFQRAIGKDPNFARAHAGLALAHGVQPNYDGPFVPTRPLRVRLPVRAARSRSTPRPATRTRRSPTCL